MLKLTCPFCHVRLRVDRDSSWEAIRTYFAVHLRRCDVQAKSAGEARMIAISIANEIVDSRA